MKHSISQGTIEILGIEAENVYAVLDGDPLSVWHQPKGTKLPADLVIDLGKKKI